MPPSPGRPSSHGLGSKGQTNARLPDPPTSCAPVHLSTYLGDRGSTHKATRDPLLPQRHVQHGLAGPEGPQGPRAALPLHQRPLQLARPAVRASLPACLPFVITSCSRMPRPRPLYVPTDTDSSDVRCNTLKKLITGSRRCTRRWRGTTLRCVTPRMCLGCASRRSCRTGSWATRYVFAAATWVESRIFIIHTTGTQQYAFMCLPVSAFQDGEINYDNVGIGRLFEVGGRDGMVELLRPAVATFQSIEVTRCNQIESMHTRNAGGPVDAQRQAGARHRHLQLPCQVHRLLAPEHGALLHQGDARGPHTTCDTPFSHSFSSPWPWQSQSSLNYHYSTIKLLS